tara:strand:+ start:476 stop:1393 length:918 start_codon:yes stop_codon:yes gene_type:complete
MPSKPKFTIARRNKIPVLTFTEPVGVGKPVRMLLQFDQHWDNPHSDQDLIKKHMQEAVDEGAPIIMGGDTYCAMCGRYDARRSRHGIRPEHDHPNYLDCLVQGFSDFAEFAAPNIAFMGRGNHELSILKHIETDLIERTAERLRIAGSSVVTGGIGGWIIVKIHITKTQFVTVPVYYTHGTGGGGPVTKGVIQTNRRAVYLPDAQVIISGHIHEEWIVTLARERLTSRGRVYLDEQVHLCSATYKQEYDPVNSSWHSQMGRPPKPIGGTWLEMTVARETDGVLRPEGGKKQLPLFKVNINAIRAK